MTADDPKQTTAEVNVFFSLEGFRCHTKCILPQSPTVIFYKALIDRIQEAGGTPEDAVLPGKPAVAPVDDSGDTQVFSCNDCGGPMAYRKGTSKAGKPYAGWFCTKKNCKGEPIWEND